MFPKSKSYRDLLYDRWFLQGIFVSTGKNIWLKTKKIGHRNKPNRMSDAEMMVILILFHSGGFRCFKHYYKEYVCKHLEHLFPHRVSYNRFVELRRKYCFSWPSSSKSTAGTCTGISFVDSPPLRVCRNQRILIHKTFEGLAERGRCSMGWFFRFKLHLIINDKGEISISCSRLETWMTGNRWNRVSFWKTSRKTMCIGQALFENLFP